MDRKNFLKRLLVSGVGALASLGGIPSLATSGNNKTQPANKFTLDYAPHFGMFKEHAGNDLLEQLRFMHNAGFRSLEDNEMRNRSEQEQKLIASEMSRLNMSMGVFVAHTIGWSEPNVTADNEEAHNKFLDEIRESVDIAKRVNATWMTVVPGRLHPRLEMPYQTANVIQVLKKAAAILEPHGLVMVLEPLNPLRDHPGQFLTKTSQAYEICKAVDSPSCKILYDVYHQQITEGNLIPNIDYAWDEIAYFQVGDNPGRNEPTTGEINYKNVFDFIHNKGYQGIIGMEHGKSMSGKKGEQAVIEAYRTCDPSF
ncbi:MAG: hydroxypyruvate isomerase family protein [Candidatus Halalkalibacterium sp. M3_1C_030]